MKKVIKKLWDESRMEDAASDKLREMGICSIEGKVGNLLFRALGTVQALTGEESDEFADEFMHGEDFEVFYKKWVERK